MDDWNRRDLPILKKIAEIEAAGGDRLDTLDLERGLGLQAGDVSVGLEALAEAGYASWNNRARYGVARRLLIWPRLLEKGRRELGLWPTQGIDALVSLLEDRIAAETDPAVKGKLERLRDALIGVGRDVATSLLAAWLKGKMELP